MIQIPQVVAWGLCLRFHAVQNKPVVLPQFLTGLKRCILKFLHFRIYVQFFYKH